MGSFLVVVSRWGYSNCSVWVSHCSGFPWCGAQALGCMGFSSCGMWAQKLQLLCSGAQAQLLRGIWDLRRSGIKPMSPELAGGCITTEPPGKPKIALQSWAKGIATFPNGNPMVQCLSVLSLPYIKRRIIKICMVYLFPRDSEFNWPGVVPELVITKPSQAWEACYISQ